MSLTRSLLCGDDFLKTLVAQHVSSELCVSLVELLLSNSQDYVTSICSDSSSRLRWDKRPSAIRQPDSFLLILFFKCSFIFSSSSESDLNSSGQQPDENREHKTGSKERKMSVDIVRDLSLLPLVSCSHACCETVLKTLELMSQLKQHVDDMETCFYRMLQVKC